MEAQALAQRVGCCSRHPHIVFDVEGWFEVPGMGVAVCRCEEGFGALSHPASTVLVDRSTVDPLRLLALLPGEVGGGLWRCWLLPSYHHLAQVRWKVLGILSNW